MHETNIGVCQAALERHKCALIHLYKAAKMYYNAGDMDGYKEVLRRTALVSLSLFHIVYMHQLIHYTV